jgi:hypothetical protein
MKTLSSKSLAAFPESHVLNAALVKLFTNITQATATRIVERQIFSERERYTIKKEVDEALLSSELISKTTEVIKKCCDTDNLNYVDDYLELLKVNLHELMSVCTDFCENYGRYENDQAAFLTYLNKYVQIADIDNAHAMYLSSDNWDFSVFHNVINRLYSEYSNPKEFEAILKGGIIDIRTRIYHIAGEYIKGSTLADHVAYYLSQTDVITPELWSPILLYPFYKGDARPLHNSMPYYPEENELVAAYNKLYHARYLYDSLEYFGFYGFVRNAIGDLCQSYADRIGNSEFSSYAKYITLYQFNFCSTLKKTELWNI